MNKYAKDLEDDEMRTKIVKASVFVHQSVERKSVQFYDELRRHNYVTPTSYLELLTTFSKLLKLKKEELGTTQGRLQIGLDKLMTTAEEVERMQEDLRDLQPVLQKTQKETEEMEAVIAKDKEEADKTKIVVTKQEEDANIQAAEAKEIADDAERDLAQALPALDEALQSLNQLSRNDIVEVKSMRNPPEGVKLVMEATCIMFSVAPKMVADPNKVGKKMKDYWEPSTKLLTDTSKFLDSLMSFDKDNISDNVISQIEPFISDENFTPANVSRVSKACTSICMWARAMNTYNQVSKQVAPKRARLEQAQQTLNTTLQVTTSAMSNSRYVLPFDEEITDHAAT